MKRPLLQNNQGDQLHRLFGAVFQTVPLAIAGGGHVAGVEQGLRPVVAEHGLASEKIVELRLMVRAARRLVISTRAVSGAYSPSSDQGRLSSGSTTTCETWR